jgi:hypothetical protein
MYTRRLSASDVSKFKSWNFPRVFGPYGSDEIVQPNSDAFAVYADNVLVGFGLTGADAILQGLEPMESELDVWLAKGSDFVEKGCGLAFVQAALQHFTTLARNRKFSHLRCAIFSGDDVPMLMAERQGFVRCETVVNDSVEFVILRKEIRQFRPVKGD